MDIKRLPIGKVELNKGQIEGLPANPRQWTQTDIDKIAVSLKETPELFEMRPLIVVEHNGKYVILAGSLRWCGAKQNGDKDVPAVVVPDDMSVAKMKEVVIKDNGAFGAWDYDALGNEWDDLPLGDWGVEKAVNVEEELEKVEKEEQIEGEMDFVEVLNERHNYVVLYFDNEVDWLQAESILDLKVGKLQATGRNGNSKAFNKSRYGIGRVMKGKEAIQKIMDEAKKINGQ